jgi:hypothetical protein
MSNHSSHKKKSPFSLSEFFIRIAKQTTESQIGTIFFGAIRVLRLVGEASCLTDAHCVT